MAIEAVTPPFVLPDLSDVVLTAKFFRALGDPTRLRMLEAIVKEEKSVSHLVELTGAPQGRVSSHLACLRWCGFVRARRDGRHVYYRVTDPRVKQILRLGDSLVKLHAERIRACTIVDEKTGSRRPREGFSRRTPGRR